MMLKRAQGVNADPQRRPAAQPPPTALPPLELPPSSDSGADDDSHRSEEVSGCSKEDSIEYYYNNYDNVSDSKKDDRPWTPTYYNGDWNDSHRSKESTDCSCGEGYSPNQCCNDYYDSNSDSNSDDGLWIWTPVSFAGNRSGDEGVYRCTLLPKPLMMMNRKRPREASTIQSQARAEKRQEKFLGLV